MNVVVYSNCQADGIIFFLSQKIVGKYTHIPNYKYFDKPHDLPISILKNADLFLFQFTNKKYGICSTDINADENILRFLKKGCITIGFPCIFQSSFWPVIPEFGSCRDGHEIVHNYKSNNVSLSEIIHLFNNNNICFNLKQRFDACEKHTLEIENYYLEKTTLKSIKVTDFIRENYKKYRLFMSHCHPSAYIYIYIVNNIIEYINNIQSKTIQIFENIFDYNFDEGVKHLRPSILWSDSQYVKKELSLEYNTTPDEVIILKNIYDIYNSIN